MARRENPVARTAKALRYLQEGRLRVLVAGPGRVAASCRGSETLWSPCYVDGGWRCDCPASGLCSHLVALQLVCAVDLEVDGA